MDKARERDPSTESVPRIDLKAALTGYLPGDPPLMEEFGINLSSIKKDSLRVLYVLFRSPECDEGSTDVAGPILFLVLFCLVLFLRGRIHFGYVYFLSIISSVFIYLLAKMMTAGPISYVKVANVLGYAFLPTLAFSAMGSLLPVSKPAKLLAGVVFAMWSTYASSAEMSRSFQMHNKQLLLAYPMLMVYVCFIIVGIV